MSGVVRSIGKAFKRLADNKVVKGLMIAAAAYFIGGLAAGAMGSTTAANLPGISGAADFLGMGDVGAFAGAPPVADAVGGAVQAAAPVADAQPAAAPAPTAQAPVAKAAPVSAAPAPAAPPPGVQPPAPVSDLSAGNPAGSLSLNDGQGGIIDRTAKWFGKLSHGAQTVIAGSVAGGASGLMQALAAKNASEDAEDRDERAREDRTRRGSIPAFGSAFTPKKSGIIDSRRG